MSTEMEQYDTLVANLKQQLARGGMSYDEAVIVDDAEGICGRLDIAMQQSIDACVDPWLEATAPKTPNQFTSVVPVKEEA